ncbi:MHS family MFS transporter [Kibdelosporangium philippinense]|uniref:MHS family MFS transporter n=1 Tax=Kibdelosporangium philippinense TaxID=211113 RepID=A0ABS8Z243_9PSEU|nr:MFS transporter [Kibdelosporangium philippinense]MCE7002018.1 MHS family MFS transporter [Kibdelosporangium philippinense]
MNQCKRAAFGSLAGTTIEWYDFFIYGQAAVLVFDKLYFPGLDPSTATLVSLGTLGVGFLARPVGGVLFGHFGDRVGRKSVLIVTLLLMGVATALVGLLPTAATIGVWAPILLVLLRLVQGIAAGGEWGGAVLMAVEHAPEGRRGLYESLPQLGVPLGLIASTGVFALLSGTMSDEALLAWGWRIAFLASIVVVLVGLFIRLGVEESPSFVWVKQRSEQARVPLLEVFKHAKWTTLLTIGSQALLSIAFYVTTVYVLTYARDTVGISRTESLAALLIAATLDLIAIPCWAAISDRTGRRQVFLDGAICAAMLVYPMFWLVDTGDFGSVTAGISLMLVCGHAPMHATLASFLAEQFVTRMRYSAISLSYQISGALWSGPAPLVAAALLAATRGVEILVGIMFCALGLTAVSVRGLQETYRNRLDDAQQSAVAG